MQEKLLLVCNRGAIYRMWSACILWQMVLNRSSLAEKILLYMLVNSSMSKLEQHTKSVSDCWSWNSEVVSCLDFCSQKYFCTLHFLHILYIQRRLLFEHCGRNYLVLCKWIIIISYDFWLLCSSTPCAQVGYAESGWFSSSQKIIISSRWLDLLSQHPYLFCK